MIQDNVGQMIATEQDLLNLIMSSKLESIDQGMLVDHSVNIDNILMVRPSAKLSHPVEYVDQQTFDQQMQNIWYMPDEYKEMDIAAYVLDLCNNDSELQRAGKELLLYQERDLFDLLRYCVYLVNVMRDNNIIWGVGRGSSVSSFVLYLIGVHQVNSLYYDLSPEEFLR